jgi:hypothetical protein
VVLQSVANSTADFDGDSPLETKVMENLGKKGVVAVVVGSTPFETHFTIY